MNSRGERQEEISLIAINNKNRSNKKKLGATYSRPYGLCRLSLLGYR